MASFSERFACGECIDAILALPPDEYPIVNEFVPVATPSRDAGLEEAAKHLEDIAASLTTNGDGPAAFSNNITATSFRRAAVIIRTLASTPAPASAQELMKASTATVTLAECPVGLFTYRGTLCLKSEYGDNSGRIDAYIVSSGEFFWGGTQTASEQRKLLVTPAPDLLASLRIAVGHIEHMAAFITTMNQKHNAGYSFESLGEDMPDIRSLLSSISDRVSK